jgi:hypothetical protein
MSIVCMASVDGVDGVDGVACVLWFSNHSSRHVSQIGFLKGGG